MTKPIRPILFPMLLCMPFQSCLFESGAESRYDPCESGEYEFSRYHRYDDKDSLASILVVDRDGDTTSREYFEYDSTGFLTRSIWINYNSNPAGDTACQSIEKNAGGKEIRAFACEDETATFSIAHLNDENRTERVVYYSFDSTISIESILTYNEQGLLIRIDSKKGDAIWILGKNIYDEYGFWMEGIQYDSSGIVLWRTVNIRETSARTRANVYDKTGALSTWEVSYYNPNGKIEKSIACKTE